MRTRASVLQSSQSRFIAGCVVLALSLAGAQLWLTTSALTAAGRGEPSEVRNARRQLGELEQLQAMAAQRQLLGAADLPARFALEPAATAAAPAPAGMTTGVAAGEATGSAAIEMVLTPGLRGILEERGSDGTLRYRACFENGVYAAGDMVGEFRLRSVAADRAVLLRRGETFVVQLDRSIN